MFSPLFIYADNPYEPCFLANNSVYEVVDVVPEFPGGLEVMKTFIFENIKYPEKARKTKSTISSLWNLSLTKTVK